MHKRFHQHSFVNLFLTLFGCVTFFLAGCSDSGMGMDESVYASADMPGEAFAEKNIESNDSLGGETGEDGASGIASELPNPADRKIIYVTEIRLVLKETSFEDFEKDIAKLIKDNSAYQSEVTFNRNRGERRTGRWVVRVPVNLYQAFLVGVKDLGVPEEVQESASDVTAEYVDLVARMANQKRLEQRILSVLDEVQGKISDVLEVEKQLARVRETIERLEGKMRYIKDRVSMTTVTVHVREDEDYQPPQALSFGGSIVDVWQNSIDAMIAFSKGVVLALVAIAPWLVVVMLVGYVLYRLLRRIGVRRRESIPPKVS
ncbi:MAG: DUF4349 domain-containing protein [Opitutae bacterium]|nr:DUF4349 domain-containing protein [Opitutae bacterium]